MILCLETATNLCSVALCDNAGVVSIRESRDSKSHASMLTVFTGEVLKEAGIKPNELEAISVSKGPGSYTGLRIGVSAAKGIAYAASVPLIGIETTMAMFHGLTQNKAGCREADSKTLYCPMLDARRMEVYYAVYDCMGRTVRNTSALVIDKTSFSDIPLPQEIVFFGEGALKLRDILIRPNIRFEEDFKMSASHLLIPSLRALRDGKLEDIAYFEPLYLKDFITTVQKKNLLGR